MHDPTEPCPPGTCDDCDGWRERAGVMFDRPRDPGDGRDPSITANVPGSNPSGPAPYVREPRDVIWCGNCGCYNTAEARHCDQCGWQLAPGGGFTMGTAEMITAADHEMLPYTEDDVITCPSCGQPNSGDAIACRRCGREIPGSAYAAALNNATAPDAHEVSSSGRLEPGTYVRTNKWGEHEYFTVSEDDYAGEDDYQPRGPSRRAALTARLDRLSGELDDFAPTMTELTTAYRAVRAEVMERWPDEDPDVAVRRQIARQHELTVGDLDLVTRFTNIEAHWTAGHRREDAMLTRESHILADLYDDDDRETPGELRPIDRSQQVHLMPMDRSREQPPLHRDGIRPIDRSQQQQGPRPIDRSR